MPLAVLEVVLAGLVGAIVVAVVLVVACIGMDVVAALVVMAATSHPVCVLMVNATCVVTMDIVHMIAIFATLVDMCRHWVVSLQWTLLFAPHHQLQTLEQVPRLWKTERGSSHYNLGDCV